MHKERKGPPHTRTLGELRRFELKTDDPLEIEMLDRVIESKNLSRIDIGIILLFLGVRPGLGPIELGIHKHNSQEHP